jgi:hypothetical protein
MGHHTFWGRSMASALKYLQALSDETVRNIVRKFRQAIEPPRGVKSTERIYTRDIYTAGKISYGVDADVLKPLTTHSGITEAEMTMMSTVKQLQDEIASRGDTQLGVTPKKKQSATAVVEQQKQAIKMLGQLVLAYSSLVRQMTENRIFNIIESFSESDSRDYDASQKLFVEKFRRFTLKDQPLDNGSKGDKIVQFMGRDLNEKEHLAIDDWDNQQQENGKPMKMTVVNIKKLRKAAVMWFVTVATKPKEDDDLHKLMFQDKFSQAQGISQAVQRPLNAERIVDEFERTWKANEWFKEPEPQPQGQPQPPDQQGQKPQGVGGGEQPQVNDAMSGTGLGGDLTQGLRQSTKKPEMPNAKPKALVGAV